MTMPKYAPLVLTLVVLFTCAPTLAAPTRTCIDQDLALAGESEVFEFPPASSFALTPVPLRRAIQLFSQEITREPLSEEEAYEFFVPKKWQRPFPTIASYHAGHRNGVTQYYLVVTLPQGEGSRQALLSRRVDHSVLGFTQQILCVR